MEKTQVAIVGAGPIGIELAAALARRGISYVHLEAGQIGGTIAWYAPYTTFFSSSDRISIAGIPLLNASQTKATREQYLTYLRGVVQQLKLPIRTYQRVRDVERGGGGEFVLRIASSEHAVGGPEEASKAAAQGDELPPLAADKLVLAIGDMHRPRLLKVPGETLPHVSHYFADPHKFFGKRVLIVGGKNSAVEAAIRLQRVGCDVTLSYRKETLDEKRVKYWLLPELKGLIKRGLIKFAARSEVLQIERDHVLLRCVQAEQRIEADFVLLLTGYVQDGTLFERAGVALEGEGRRPVYKRATMETNVPGLFVAGTAAAGTQIGGVKEFIETSHIHVERIVAALCGEEAPADPELPESYQLES